MSLFVGIEDEQRIWEKRRVGGLEGRFFGILAQSDSLALRLVTFLTTSTTASHVTICRVGSLLLFWKGLVAFTQRSWDCSHEAREMSG